MTAVSDRLDRIAATRTEDWPTPEVVSDVLWLLALARGHQATLEQIAFAEPVHSDVPLHDQAAFLMNLARERLREAEGE